MNEVTKHRAMSSMSTMPIHYSEIGEIKDLIVFVKLSESSVQYPKLRDKTVFTFQKAPFLFLLQNGWCWKGLLEIT